MWNHLERAHGLAEIRAAAQPHVTYLLGDVSGGAARVEALVARAAAAASRLAPVEVEIEGVGVFDGPAPVVYLRVAPNERLRNAHAALLEATRDAFESIWLHYQPEAWTPHVTLALRDLSRGRLSTVRADLETRVRPLRTRLESIDVVHVVFPQHVYLRRFSLGTRAAR